MSHGERLLDDVMRGREVVAVPLLSAEPVRPEGIGPTWVRTAV